VKHELVDLLRCPRCRARLRLHAVEEERGQVKTGTLTCADEGHVYSISRWVPRFVDADAYADSFSRQRLYVRRHFDDYLKDRSGDRLFFPTTGFSPDGIRQGTTLEIGCGYGRFVDVVQRAGGRIVGVDLSTHSIDLAHDFVGFRENVHLVQADLFALPFARESFGHVYSLGVLHHTPSTARAFEAVVPYVAPEGHIAIWVYHPDEKRSSNRWRRLTTRMNHRLLYGACVVNQALFSWVRALPGGWRFGLLVPGAAPRPGRTFWMRVLGDFDNLSPVFAHVHREDEVAGWFRTAGLTDVKVLPRRTAVSGRRA
jgi:SAM-dependent methyltransferase